jgi:uncharacterized protein YjbJ (UPF0337 family)
MKESTTDRAEGKGREVKGAMKEAVGADVRGRGLEAKGKVEKKVEKAQRVVGRMEKTEKE